LQQAAAAVVESTTPVVRNSRTLDERHGPAQGWRGAEPGRRKGPVTRWVSLAQAMMTGIGKKSSTH